jgi:hypothetical protein
MALDERPPIRRRAVVELAAPLEAAPRAGALLKARQLEAKAAVGVGLADQ